MICQVWLFTNGLVVVFDELGQRMSEYQGLYASVKGRILKAAPPETLFYLVRWKGLVKVLVSREQFNTINV